MPRKVPEAGICHGINTVYHVLSTMSVLSQSVGGVTPVSKIDFQSIRYPRFFRNTFLRIVNAIRICLPIPLYNVSCMY